MSQITLQIPDELLLALHWTEAGNALRMTAAVKLFELGHISSGAAAKLAGLPRVLFLTKLADYGVDTFSLTKEELQGETRLV
jgi:predicted HTH domain antitoxin